MLDNTTIKAARDLGNSFANYLYLYSWFQIKYKNQFTDRTFTFTSVEDFWKKIFSEELRNGDIIKFKEGFFTDWIPKVAGQVWKTFDSTFPTNVINIEEVKKGQEFSSSGIVEDEQLHSLGVVRLPFSKSKENFTVLSLTSFDCWSVDLGIPILVSKKIYEAFLQKRRNNQSVEGDIEAILEIGNYPGFNNEFIKSYGSTINEDFLKQFTSPVLVPRVFLRVSSPLNIKFRTHNSHPFGTIWALTKSERPYQIRQKSDMSIYRVDESQSWIGLELAHIDISNIEEIEYYAKAFKEGHTRPLELFPDIRIIKDPEQNISILTEFDAQKRHFINSIPIEKEPWNKEGNRQQIIEALLTLEKNQK